MGSGIPGEAPWLVVFVIVLAFYLRVRSRRLGKK